jgi:hypothetical protein
MHRSFWDFTWVSSDFKGESLDGTLKQNITDSSPTIYNELHLHKNYFLSTDPKLAHSNVTRSLNKSGKTYEYLT